MGRGLIHAGAWDGREYLDWQSDEPLICFEPQRRPFAQLQINLGARPNTELWNVALGAEAGTVTMHTAQPDHSSSLLSPTPSDGSDGIGFDGSTETVTMVTLDQVIRDSNGYDTLRIDTQGYELEVLKGAERTLEQIDRVELEIHRPNVYEGAGTLNQIKSFLAKRGFELVAFDEEGSDDLGDAVFERKDPS
jgi:FkbM family methyltransferase